MRHIKQEKCSFFEKKEPGKLSQIVKFFWFFFFKKRTLLPFLFFVTSLARAADPCDTLVLPPGVGLGSPADITALNLLLTDNTYNQEAASYLYADLLWIDQKDQIDFSRSIASRIEVLDSGQRYRVTLSPWPWSDGRPVTADDVLYTWELIQELGSNYVTYGQGGVPALIKRLDVLNPSQFEITLKQPVNPDWFELNGLVQFIPLPRHSWGKLSVDQLWENQSEPQFFDVVDGPFRLDKFNLGRSISFVPNPSYPLTHSPFKRMVIKFLQSSGSELQGISAGELDLANLPHEAFEAGKSIRNAHMVVEPPGFTYTFIGLNFKNPATSFLTDVRVRQAIQDSIDQKSMIADLWHGEGVESYGPIPGVATAYLSPSARAGRFPIGFNLKKAAALLDQAGYVPGPDGIRAKHGVKLELTLLAPSGTETSLMMAQMIQPDLRKSGIALHIQMMDFTQMLAILEHGVAPWEAYVLDAGITAYPSGETTFATGAVENWGDYSDPKMDQLIADSTDKPGLDGLYQFQDYVTQQLPFIFLPTTKNVVLERNGILGAERVISPGNDYNPQLISLDRAACHAAH